MSEILITNVKDIGKIIRDRRKEQGLKQSEAAALLGVGTRFLSELERGSKDTLSIGKVIQIINRFGCSITVETKKHKI